MNENLHSNHINGELFQKAAGKLSPDSTTSVKDANPSGKLARKADQTASAMNTESAAGTPNSQQENTLSRYRGCLLGGAVGDALGYPPDTLPGRRSRPHLR